MDFPANRFSGVILATLNFLGQLSPVTGAASAAILIVTVALPGYFYLKKDKNKHPRLKAEFLLKTAAYLPRWRQGLSTLCPPQTPRCGISLGFVGGRISEIVVHQDAEYAEELQLQEALVASLCTGQSSNHASLSVQDDQLNSFCEICLDNKGSWEMFKNDGCSHSFCYECTSKHIIARISEKEKVIGCPGVSCSAALDVNACRFMIPKEALIRWDESVCQSMILDSQKLYCPFRDCSALLVNDSGASIGKIKCPLCKRLFCAACRVPWHSEFTCKEFQKLNAKKRGKGEDMVKTLAKKKNWQKCPNCKIFVEKTEGCIHMTCRCEYEFCYRCGAKWTGSHNCRKK